MEYRGYMIEAFLDGFTVFYCGDEVYFDTVEDAKEFIREVEKEG